MHSYQFVLFEFISEANVRRLGSFDFPGGVVPFVPVVGDKVSVHVSDSYVTGDLVKRATAWVIEDGVVVSSLTLFLKDIHVDRISPRRF